MRSIFKCPLTSTPLITSIGVQAFTSELRTILLSDGDFNFQDWIATEHYSEGLQKLFKTSAE